MSEKPDKHVSKSKLTTDRQIPGAFEGETVTRRRFMVGTVHTTGAIATAAFVLPALGFALGPVFEQHKEGWQDIGAVDEFSKTDYVPKTLQISDGIGETGRATAYVRAYNPAVDTSLPNVSAEYNHFIAISSSCMHLGCPVQWTPAAERFICPCHGGVYNALGKVAGGPPVRPLDRYYTRIVRNPAGQDRVQVGPKYSVNSNLQVFSPRDPGEPLDGIGQYLYPSRPTLRKDPNQ